MRSCPGKEEAGRGRRAPPTGCIDRSRIGEVAGVGGRHVLPAAAVLVDPDALALDLATHVPSGDADLGGRGRGQMVPAGPILVAPDAAAELARHVAGAVNGQRSGLCRGQLLPAGPILITPDAAGE